MGVVLPVRTGEDSGRAAEQRRRVDARAFEDLPGRFEQQPLLGVHRQRLTRRDPEELGVEVSGFVQEAALSCGRGARAGGVGTRTVERTEVPSAVLRQGGDAVRSGGQQVPQLFRRGDATGEAAAHADDGDRVVRIVPAVVRSRQGSAVLRRPQLGTQVACKSNWGRVVVNECRRQAEPRCGVEPVAQLDRADRAESEVQECSVCRHRFLGSVAQQRGGLVADQVQQQAEALLFRHGPQACGERRTVYGLLLRRAGCARVRLMDVGQLAEQWVGPKRRVPPGGPVPPHICHDERGLVILESLLQGQERQFRVHGADTAAREVLFLRGSEASAVPVTPLDRDGCQAFGAAMVGEGVEEGVGRGVVPLTGAADQTCDGGEEHESGEVELAGEFVQIHRGS